MYHLTHCIMSLDTAASRQGAIQRNALLAALLSQVIHTWLALPVLGMKKLPGGAAPALPSDGAPGRKKAGCTGRQSCEVCISKPFGALRWPPQAYSTLYAIDRKRHQSSERVP